MSSLEDQKIKALDDQIEVLDDHIKHLNNHIKLLKIAFALNIIAVIFFALSIALRVVHHVSDESNKPNIENVKDR